MTRRFAALLLLPCLLIDVPQTQAAMLRAPVIADDATAVIAVKSAPRKQAQTDDVLPVWPFHPDRPRRDLAWLLFGEPWGPDDEEARREQIRAFFER